MVTRFLLANLTRDKKKKKKDTRQTTAPKDMSEILSLWSIVTGRTEIKAKWIETLCNTLHVQAPWVTTYNIIFNLLYSNL